VRFTVHRNLISGPFSTGVDHALSNKCYPHSIDLYYLSELSYPREPFTDMDHLIGCASSSVPLVALFANAPTANASTSSLRAKFGKVAGEPS
jgi:hypothetical protein